MPTPTPPQTNSALSQSLDSSDLHPGRRHLGCVAGFQAETKACRSAVEGDLGSSATVAKRKLHATRNSAAITTNWPRRPRKSYHISKPSQEDLCDAANLFSALQPA